MTTRPKAAQEPLMEEFEYYLEHQEEMVAKYNGKVIAIKGQEVLGAYESELEALTETRETHELGTFLIQRVSPGPEAYTHTFHSRVRFT